MPKRCRATCRSSSTRGGAERIGVSNPVSRPSTVDSPASGGRISGQMPPIRRLLEAFRASRTCVAPPGTSGAWREAGRCDARDRTTHQCLRRSCYPIRPGKSSTAADELGRGHLSRHPALEKTHALQTRQPPHGGIDLPGHRLALAAGEEIPRQETRLFGWRYSPPHRRPVVLYDQAGEPRRPPPDEPAGRLTEVKIEVPCLVPHDAGEELAQ